MLKTYILSLLAGILIGVFYAVIDVGSPAPPVIALLGLLGMQIGEHLIPVGKRLLNREKLHHSWFRHEYPSGGIDTPASPRDKTS
ncbi:ABC transporter substrate-binding protein [Pantoea wallisii]|uniref:ABC transporter substrate-binding protein n=1 Tax=Pantoea wallisii TaxID=1076551 RepID=A0A1X1DDS2_9GAMM|nr:DUF1427 family protein [Pantoea wallisii]ORM74641.1 ABC transporter substrate-binding protein [Pantoea wallisii]